MRVTITDREFALLSKRKTALDEAAQQFKLTEVAHRAAEQQAIFADQALRDVIGYCANTKEQVQYTSFAFGKDDQGYFLTLTEAEKPASPNADPPAAEPAKLTESMTAS